MFNQSSTMGKTKSVVWKYFTDKKGDTAFTCCNFCSKCFKKNATRQTSHLLNCIKVPILIKKQLKKSDSNKGKDIESDETDSEFEIEPVEVEPVEVETYESVPVNKATKQKPSSSRALSSFADIVTDKQSESLTKKLARAIYVSGTPLQFTESPVWKDLFKEIRPAYKMPSRYQLSNKLLDNEFKEIKSKVMEKINEAPVLTLQTDAWSNIRNDSITNYIINTPAPVFFRSVHTKAERHTGLFLASEIKKIFSELGSEKFLGLISDNGANIKLARELIAEEFPHIVEYGCICHALNLLIGNFF